MSRNSESAALRRRLAQGLWATVILCAAYRIVSPETAAAVPLYQVDFSLRDSDQYHRSHSGIAGAQHELPWSAHINNPGDAGAWLFFNEGSTSGRLTYNVLAEITFFNLGGAIVDQGLIRTSGELNVIRDDGALFTAGDLSGTIDHVVATGPATGSFDTSSRLLIDNGHRNNPYTFLQNAFGHVLSFDPNSAINSWVLFSFGSGDMSWSYSLAGFHQIGDTPGTGTSVPEPGTIMLLGSALVAGISRRRRHA